MNRYIRTRPKEQTTFLDVMFFLWLTSDFLFLHTKIAQVALLGFAGASFLDMVFIRKKVNFSYLFVFYGLFCVFAYLTTALGYSINPSISGEFMRTLLINAVFLVTAYNYFARTSFDKTKRILIGCAVVSALSLTIMNFLETRSILFRGSEGGYNPNSVAVFVSYIISLILCTTKNYSTRLRVILVILFIFLVLASTRKAPFIIAIIMLIYYCFKYPNKLPKYVILFALIAIAFYFLLMNIPFLYNSIGIRIESLFLFLQGEEGDGSLVSRSAYIELGMQYFAKSPLWGNGVDCFRTLEGAYKTYSHNNYVELLFSVGLFGTITYYFIYLVILVKSIVQYVSCRTPLACISFAFTVAYLIIDYAQVSYYDRNTIFIFILCAAILSKKRRMPDEEMETINSKPL